MRRSEYKKGLAVRVQYVVMMASTRMSRHGRSACAVLNSAQRLTGDGERWSDVSGGEGKRLQSRDPAVGVV